MIKKLRKDYKITQIELAKKVGVTQQQISSWEKRGFNITLNTLCKILKHLNLSLAISKKSSQKD